MAQQELFQQDILYFDEKFALNPQYEIVQEEVEALKKSLTEFNDIASKINLLQVE